MQKTGDLFSACYWIAKMSLCAVHACHTCRHFIFPRLMVASNAVSTLFFYFFFFFFCQCCRAYAF